MKAKVIVKEKAFLHTLHSFFLCYFIILVIIIALAELSVQKNHITDVGNWGYEQILAMTIAVADVISTFSILILSLYNEITEDGNTIKKILQNRLNCTGEVNRIYNCFLIAAIFFMIFIYP